MFAPILLDAHNPGPMTGRGNNTYLIVGSNGEAALIDAGVGEPRHLAEIGRQLVAARGSLACVLVTHGHADHAAGAAAIAAVHPRASFAKFPWPEEDGRFGVVWQELADEDRIAIGEHGLAVLHTPGHSPDHVAFWHEPSRTAFTGDLVVQGSSVMIHASRGGSLAAYLAALERLRALDARVLLPAHGPAMTEPRAVLDGYLEHRRMREAQVVAALSAGHSTVQAIAETIYDGLGPALMAAARENVRAHLDKLAAEGRAAEHDGHWRA